MSAAFAYNSDNTRDIKFILCECSPYRAVFEYASYRENYPTDKLPEIINSIAEMASRFLAPVNDFGELNPPRLIDGKVIGPPGYAEMFNFLMKHGWSNGKVREYGLPMPYCLYGSALELLVAAAPALMPYVALTAGVAEQIELFGDEHLKNLFVARLRNGTWSGTMCLTEITGGSDVGETSTIAEPTDDKRIYQLKGKKTFVYGGDHDMTENIVYLCLARIKGAKKGVSGLSLFVVPKLWIKNDGTFENNDIRVIDIENKMGLRGSAVVTLEIGSNGKCRGWIVGEPPGNDGIGQGMRQMFHMMNGSRVKTGIACLGITANAYLNAYEYAKSRIQGRPIENPHADRVPIIKHEDIRRMLMEGKAIIEAMRALLSSSFYYHDVLHNDADKSKQLEAREIIDILTPLCKAYCSSEAWETLANCMQVYGGRGYRENEPIARAIRDYKVLSIWEGTNYLQAIDFVFRKWHMKKGKSFIRFMKQIRQQLIDSANSSEFCTEYELLKKAHQTYFDMHLYLIKDLNNYKIRLRALYATRLLNTMANLYCGILLMQQADTACAKIKQLESSDKDYPYYLGKIASAKYYVKVNTPQILQLSTMLKNEDFNILNLPDEAFGY